MKFKLLFLAFLVMLDTQAQNKKNGTNKSEAVDGIYVTIATNKGDITLQLEYQKSSELDV